MKKFLMIIVLMFLLTGCNKTEEVTTTPSTTEYQTTTQITTENSYNEYIEFNHDNYLIFGRDTDDVKYQDIKIFNDNKEYDSKQVSEEYILQFYADENGQEKIDSVNENSSLSIPIIDEYIEDTAKEDLVVCLKQKFDDKQYRYIEIETTLDDNKAFLIFHPNTSGVYIVAKKIDSEKFNECNAKIVKDSVYNGINKTAYSLSIKGNAVIEIYSNNKLVDSIETENNETKKEIKKEDFLISLGGLDVSAAEIEINNDKDYYFKVIPNGSCEILIASFDYLNISTNSDDISLWDTRYYDDNTFNVITYETINSEKIYRK